MRTEKAFRSFGKFLFHCILSNWLGKRKKEKKRNMGKEFGGIGGDRSGSSGI